MELSTQALASKIDHTLLKPDATEAQIIQLCQEAREYSFFSVCVAGSRLSLARRELAQSRVKLCSVVGFPTGAHLSSAKADEAKRLRDAGAHELDMVINIGALKDRNEIAVVEDIENVVRAADGLIVKVIIETPLLTESEKVKACEYIVKAGAQFVKTCTGFQPGGASVEDIQLIRQNVGNTFRIKASGGIQTWDQARALIEAGADRLGCSKSASILQSAEKKE